MIVSFQESKNTDLMKDANKGESLLLASAHSSFHEETHFQNLLPVAV